jgi:hypothetical protein
MRNRSLRVPFLGDPLTISRAHMQTVRLYPKPPDCLRSNHACWHEVCRTARLIRISLANFELFPPHNRTGEWLANEQKEPRFRGLERPVALAFVQADTLVGRMREAFNGH